MKKTNKILAFTLGTVMAFSAAASVTASAESYSIGDPLPIWHKSVSVDSISYRLLQNDTYENTVYINPDELKNGSYTFQAGLYLEGKYEDFADMEYLACNWDGMDENGNLTDYIITNNVIRYNYQWNDEKTNMHLNQIFPTTEDPSIPEHKRAFLVSYSKDKEAWINKITGDNKMAQFDVTVDQNTPEGVYYIGFVGEDLSGSNFMSSGGGEDRWLYPSNVYQLDDIWVERLGVPEENNDSSYWLKIVVGDQNEESESYTIEHATAILTTYAENAVRSSTDMPLLKSTYMGDDINGDGVVDIADATAVLEQYAKNAAKLN